MKFYLRLLILFFLPVAVWAQSPGLPEVTQWPGNRTAAISLTFDDGLMSQLHNAAPVMEKYHLHGTFFVITGSKNWLDHISEWRRLEQEGNEIGSHAVHHPCMYPTITPHSEDYTPAMMEAEVRDSAHAISAALGTHRGLTFAYPCDNETFGPPWDATRNQVLYLSYVAKHYFAARMDNGGLPNDPPELNPLTIHGLSRVHYPWIHFAQILAMLEPVVSTHQWGVYEFHGIGGEYLATNQEAFNKLCSYLQQHQEIWTGTFGNVVRYILEQRALTIKAAGSSGSQAFRYSLGWPMNPKVYDLPLTLEWKLPRDWTECRVTGDGHPLGYRTLTESSGKRALVDVAVQTKTLVFERQ